MSHAQISVSERRPKRFGTGAARLLVLAIIALHGMGRAAEAAAPAVAQAPVVVAETGWSLTGVPAPRDHCSAQAAASAPRGPRPDAARVGGGECCKSPTCRCGCLHSVAAIAIAALGDR